MGSYWNPGSHLYQRSLRSQIYVDKSSLIAKINAAIGTEQNCICVSRPRRFGKSMAANMLAAYYGYSEDTDALFQELKISQDPSYREHLNRYDVVKLNIQGFLSKSNTVEEMLVIMQERVIREMKMAYPEININSVYLDWAMEDIYAHTNRSFIILIDEWDCLFREFKDDTEAQEKYLDFLRVWLKDQPYVGLAYMTGILPIKKYGTHSALNMFWEYSMSDPGDLAPFFGFMESEVKELCEQYDMSFEETRAWYDGYVFAQHHEGKDAILSMYNPKSVVEAMLRRKFGTYWNQTETYEALKIYIQMNFDGLKDAVVTMLAGGQVRINTGTFSNDMTTFGRKDDVLTLLVHLGYLTYDIDTATVTIPNNEVSQEYINAIQVLDWKEVIQSIEDSQKLLQALWNMDAEAVACGIDLAHQEVSILQYNDENALSYTINLAFYFTKEYYTVVRELPTGKGFADICFIPREFHCDKPAVLIELKWDKSAKGAIEQIKQKNYVAALKEYSGNLILAGINYNKATKIHECEIEKVIL